MRKTLMEPLNEPVLAVLKHEKKQEYSEWRLPMSFLEGGTAGYQNRDFRNSDGTPVIDPDTYCKLRNEVMAVGTTASRKFWLFFFILFIALHGLSMYYLGFVDSVNKVPDKEMTAFFYLVLLLMPFVSKYFIFKKADADLHEIVRKYKGHFYEAYGVTVGYSKCTKRVRWLADDSGVYLLRPRTLFTPEAESDPTDFDGNFPPIHMCLGMPGNVHIDEAVYDSSMKVDANVWELLQSTHKEMEPFALSKRYWRLQPYFFAAYNIISIWFSDLPYCFLKVHGDETFHNLLIQFLTLGCMTFIVTMTDTVGSVRNYQEISERVNAALKKDENTSHLTLSFLATKPDLMENQRYQFARLGVLDPFPPAPVEHRHHQPVRQVGTPPQIQNRLLRRVLRFT
jgi:hypothetical protein